MIAAMFVDPGSEPDAPDHDPIAQAVVYDILPRLSAIIAQAAHDLLGEPQEKVDPLALRDVEELLREALTEYLNICETMRDLRPVRARKHFGETILPSTLADEYPVDLAGSLRREIDSMMRVDYSDIEDEDLLWSFQHARYLYRRARLLYRQGNSGRKATKRGERLLAQVAYAIQMRGLRLP